MGNQKEIMRDSLKEELRAYYREYMAIRNSVDLHDELFRMTLNDPGKKVLGRAPYFFSIVYDALSDSFSISLAKLFDKGENTKSVQNLIERCKKESHLFRNPEKVTEILEMLEKELKQNCLVGNALCVLQNRRDKLYAHNDKKYFRNQEKILEEPLHIYQIWELLNWIKQVLMFLVNEMSVDVSDFTEYSEHPDLKNLLSSS